MPETPQTCAILVLMRLDFLSPPKRSATRVKCSSSATATKHTSCRVVNINYQQQAIQSSLHFGENPHERTHRPRGLSSDSADFVKFGTYYARFLVKHTDTSDSYLRQAYRLFTMHTDGALVSEATDWLTDDEV